LVTNASRPDDLSPGTQYRRRTLLLSRGGRSLSRELTAPLAPAQSGGRLPGIEGLRALAAASILVYHCWLYSAPSGRPVDLGLLSRFAFRHLPAGVLLFFTLSGFLLYRPLAAAVLRQAPFPSTRRYLRNRALRIFPAYLVILLVIGVLLPAGLMDRSPSGWRELGRLSSDPIVLLANAALVQNYFHRSMDSGIGPAWSLAVELVFYLLLPLFGWLAAACARPAATPRGRTWAVLVPVAVVIAIGMSGSVTATYLLPPGSGAWHNGVVRSFWSHADLFALGMALAVLRVNLEDGRLGLPSWWRKATAAGMVGVTLLTVFLTDRGRIIPPHRGTVVYETLVTLACALLLALVVLPTAKPAPRPALVRLLETRLFIAVGLVSYSLFLLHEPIIRLLQQRGWTMGGARGFWMNLLVLMVLSGFLSGLTYRYVERPALSRKTGRVPPGPTSSAAASPPSPQAAGGETTPERRQS
jgi:peptidoglycan/LPS O-acetylase OafA/YrhL